MVSGHALRGRGRAVAFAQTDMSIAQPQGFNLERPSVPLPKEDDFGDSLDARSAWRHFGGLSLQQAYELFQTNPLKYQEDFMFMDSRAFEFYFPVVDRHLREAVPDEDGCMAAILGSGVALQLDWEDSALSRAVLCEIEVLSAFVQSNLSRFSADLEELKRIGEEWRKVDGMISQHKSMSARHD